MVQKWPISATICLSGIAQNRQQWALQHGAADGRSGSVQASRLTSANR
jgi:hypothetical protein